MNFMKGNKLERKADIVQRGVCRVVWVTIPGLIIAFGSALFGFHRFSVWFFAFIIAIPVLGVLVDGLRLKFKGSSNQ